MHKSKIIILVVLLMLRCNSVIAEEQAQVPKMYENVCSSCHSLEPPPKLAPPLRGIYMHYSMNYKDRESFSKAIANFVHNSDKTPPLMAGAQERFGKMPPMPLDKNELENLGMWIWDKYSK